VGRPVKANTRPGEDDTQTRFMARALIPPSSRGSNGPTRRTPIFTEERTLVDVPRPADASEDRTIVAPFVFPKAAPRATLTTSRSPSSRPPAPGMSKPTPSSVRPAPPRASQPPPLPAPRASSAAPSIPPPLPSSAMPRDQSSSPALVSDVTPSTPLPAPLSKRVREPMFLLAAALGVLGVIFTMGIVVGLVVSLRSHAGPAEASLDMHVAPVAAAAGASLVPAVAPVPVAQAAVAVDPGPIVPAKPFRIAAAKVAPVEGPADTLTAAKVAVAAPPSDAPAASPRVAHWAPVAMAAPVAKPAPVVAAGKHARAASSDPDMDAANAASDLAKAQLEASLR